MKVTKQRLIFDQKNNDGVGGDIIIYCDNENREKILNMKGIHYAEPQQPLERFFVHTAEELITDSNHSFSQGIKTGMAYTEKGRWPTWAELVMPDNE